jgi:hypothetical protein
MELRRARVTSSVRTEGGLLPADLLAKIAAGDRDVPGLTDADYALAAGDRVREAITRSWNRLVGSWAALTAARVGATDEHEPLTTPTRERWLLPLFEELGFGRLTVAARAVEIEGTSYPISHTWEQVPIHLVGFGVELDRRTPGVRGAAGAAPHALVQGYLNRSDEALWGIVTNGRLLRLLRDSTSLTRQAFVEFDLEAIFEGELYADFALLWSVCHRTRFGAAKPEECLLERWSKKAADDGTRALDKLRGGVEQAIETLGTGFLAQPTNGALREALRSGELDRQDYYRELLRLVYRLIFLFTAEDRRDETTGRELLLDPAAPDDAAGRYRRYYSTARLRSLAGRRRGTRHPDLWGSLRRVITALGGEGAPTLALPALGSFLFGSTACPYLDTADLRNENLLDAVRALATIEEDRRLRLVDYRNLGAEELGGIYEGLLELHPRIEVDATPPRFELGTTAGNERRTTGSYYTHSDLISCLLDSALDPVVDEAVRGRDREAAERAILELALVDPAAGSGHFIVAAAHRLAKRLAAIRTGEGEPAPTAVRHALRDVIAHCIYAVDINPMAVELCKVSLWLEALEPGMPLSFLDAHVKCGNSLVGATPELVTAGIPDAAYEVLDGDDPRTARGLRDRNARERIGQLGFSDIGVDFDIAGLATSWARLETMDESSLARIQKKEREYRRLLESPEARQRRRAADAWCAAFFTVKTQGTGSVTSAAIRALASPNGNAETSVGRTVDGALADVGTFHWPLEFPDIAARGGFDVVLGNPPWETLSPDAKEFFAVYDPGVRNIGPREQKALVDRLLQDPVIRAAWDVYCWHLYRLANFLRKGGRYRLFAPGNLGKGDFNVYRIFVELALQLTREGGRAAQLVPDGFYLGANASALRRELVEGWQWERVYGFENTREVWFKDIDSRTKFCIYTARKGGTTHGIEVAFGLNSEAELRRVREQGGISLTADLLRQLSPETYALPDTASLAGLDLVERISARFPRFGEPRVGWPERVYIRELDMGNDRDRFNDREGYPLYEGRMVDQFDHRAKAYLSGRGRTAVWRDLPFDDPDKRIDPQWRVRPDAVPTKVRPRSAMFRIGICDVTSPTNERTLVAALLPPGVVAGHKVPTVVLQDGEPGDYAFWLAAANSLAVDYVARRKVSLSMSYTVLDGLPLPRRAQQDDVSSEIVELAARLTCTSLDMLPFWDHLSADGWVPSRSSTEGPGLVVEDARLAARSRLDALVAVHLYGLETADMEIILEDFKALSNRERRQFGEFRTRRLVLAEMERELTDRREKKGDPTGEERARPDPGPGSSPRFGSQPQPSVPRDAADADSIWVSPSGSDGSTPDWRAETTVHPNNLVLGQRVRHRAHGEGTVLTVKPSGKGAELLVRFDVGGEKWIVFGYGVLEFADDEGARGEPA